MAKDEEVLEGGNTAAQVLRVGNTVRKPATIATPAVHALLAYLGEAGFRGAPRAFGLDEDGRQVLEFLPGPLWDRTQPPLPGDLCRVGALIREYHDAVAGFQPNDSFVWEGHAPADGDELVCHNDFAPWNLVCGADHWAFIDWDNAAPGTRLWDLAWACISFPPIVPGCDLAVGAAAIRALLDGYGVAAEDYKRLIELMWRRAGAESAFIVDGARAGIQPYARLHAEGHNQYWGPVSDYIRENALLMEELLKAAPAC